MAAKGQSYLLLLSLGLLQSSGLDDQDRLLDRSLNITKFDRADLDGTTLGKRKKDIKIEYGEDGFPLLPKCCKCRLCNGCTNPNSDRCCKFCQSGFNFGQAFRKQGEQLIHEEVGAAVADKFGDEPGQHVGKLAGEKAGSFFGKIHGWFFPKDMVHELPYTDNGYGKAQPVGGYEYAPAAATAAASVAPARSALGLGSINFPTAVLLVSLAVGLAGGFALHDFLQQVDLNAAASDYAVRDYSVLAS
jgi:hypothetical protein